jgi:hypothetical protein
MIVLGFGGLCVGALAAVGCADGRGVPSRPSACAGVAGLAATAPGNEGTNRPAASPSLSASPRSGDLHVTKECSGYTGGAGSFCTITSSNVKAIEVDSRILYLQPDQLFTPVGSDVVLDLPGPGNNTALGNCSLAVGVCTFSGGTGKFTSFSANVLVSPPTEEDPENWLWDGTYSLVRRIEPRSTCQP